MDMLYDISLYPINAQAYADSFNSAPTQTRNYWQQADQAIAVPAIDITPSSTQDKLRQPRPAAKRAPARSSAAKTQVQSAFPLSYSSVLGRYR